MRGPGADVGGPRDDGHMPPDAEFTWVPAHPTDLAATMLPLARGPFDPTQQTAAVREGESFAVWRTVRTVSGVATLRLADRDDHFRAEGWGPGADRAVASAPALTGADDDDSGFDPVLPELAAAFRIRRSWRLARTGRLFDTLVPAVLEQKVITEQAQTSYRQLLRRFGEPAPGPVADRMRVSPAPEVWRGIPSWAWHRAGVDPQRSRTVVRLSERASAIDRLAERDAALARAALCTLPGVGEWTAAETTQRALGDADAVSVGDVHLSAELGHALSGRDFTDAEMLAALAPWAGHRYRAIRLILAAGPRRPRRGPKLERVDYRAF